MYLYHDKATSIHHGPFRDTRILKIGFTYNYSVSSSNYLILIAKGKTNISLETHGYL